MRSERGEQMAWRAARTTPIIRVILVPDRPAVCAFFAVMLSSMIDGHIAMLAIVSFFKKEIKKNKIRKRGAGWEKFGKWVPPARSPPAHPTGGRFKKISSPLPFSYSRRDLRGRPPARPVGGRHPARPVGGRPPARPMGGRSSDYDFYYIFLKFIFHKLFEIQTFLNKRFIRHTLMHAYKILIQFYEEDYGI
jgi:hypothetical protein